MSQPLQPVQTPPPLELDYQSQSEYRSAPMLVKLAGIFSLVSAGLTAIAALFSLAESIFQYFQFSRMATFSSSAPTPLPTIFFWMILFRAVLVIPATAVCIVKTIGGLKLLRGGKNAWGWGLAAGISGCVELLWCSLGCVLPLAGGVYAIIILCLAHVRAYLNKPPNGFPVELGSSP